VRIAISALPLEKKNAHGNAGVARYTFWIVEALRQLADSEDLQLRVYVGEDYEPPESWIEDSRVEMVPVRSKIRKVRSLWNLFSATKEASRKDVDVWFGTSLAIPIRGRAPKVLMVHDLFAIDHPEWFSRANGFIFGVALKLSIPKSKVLMANSEATRQRLLRGWKLKADDVVVGLLGPGNDIVRVAPELVSQGELERIGVPFERFHLTLGTLEPRKNLRVAIDAVALNQSQFREDKTGLVVVGARGWKESPLFEQIEQRGVQDLVHFAGYVADEDLAKLFAKCEALLFPSLDEGFGLPVLEAQLGGGLPICSDRGAIPEVAGPGVLKVDITSPQAVASAMQLASQLDDRLQRIEDNFTFAREFTWERCARETLRGLRRAVG
jgi:glycosyltransferase involved in cell wall biosynthesis